MSRKCGTFSFFGSIFCTALRLRRQFIQNSIFVFIYFSFECPSNPYHTFLSVVQTMQLASHSLFFMKAKAKTKTYFHQQQYSSNKYCITLCIVLVFLSYMYFIWNNIWRCELSLSIFIDGIIIVITATINAISSESGN